MHSCTAGTCQRQLLKKIIWKAELYFSFDSEQDLPFEITLKEKESLEKLRLEAIEDLISRMNNLRLIVSFSVSKAVDMSLQKIVHLGNQTVDFHLHLRTRFVSCDAQ